VKKGLSTIQPLRTDEIRAIKAWLSARAKMRGPRRTLFVSERRTALSPRTVWLLIPKYGERSGLPLPAHPHMLRHACGFALADQGADTRLIQDDLGHRNIQHTPDTQPPIPPGLKDYGVTHNGKNYMQNLLQDLANLLEQDDRLVVDGQLLKNKIVELALAMDSDLIRLLLSHDGLRRHFFVDVDNILVFDKIKFQQFVSNKSFLPDSYTAFKNKIGLTTNTHYLTDSKEVVLAWPYKDCVLEGGQTKEDAKRDEIFWNETLAPDQIDRLLAPKVLTKFQKFDSRGEHKVTHLSKEDNIVINGNNLLALHTLKKTYAGKVKLVYIDPPYNTGSDEFLYNDNFSQSTWLTFIKNRIEASRDLLSPDGIFIMQLSDHRVAEAKILLDEIFGRENFINQITVKTRSPSGFKTVNLGTFETAEYLYVYAAWNKRSVKYTTQYVKSNYDKNYKFALFKNGKNVDNWKIERIDSIVAKELNFDNLSECKRSLGDTVVETKVADYALKNAKNVFRPTEINNDASQEMVSLREKSKANPKQIYSIGDEGNETYVLGGKQIYFYSNKVRNIDGELSPTMLLTNIWTDIAWEGIAKEGGVILKKGKKPERLIKRLLEMYTKKGDIVLDYFAGSGTSAAVAHKMERKYIAIEQMGYIHELPVSRLKKVIDGEQSGISKNENWNGGGSFLYCELAQVNQKFVNQIQATASKDEILSIWQQMQDKAFLSYRVDPKKIDFSKDELTLEDMQRFLIDVLDKNMLYVPLSEIDDETYDISADDKILNRQFFG